MAPRIVVVGSVNLDLVARVERLPRPGETLSGASFERFPGGKGANQAVAAARLGADVRLIGCVGSDPFADEALSGLLEAGVELELQVVDEPTGVALILVADDGENQIVVAPGANARVGAVEVGEADAVLCQLEVPDEAVRASAGRAPFFCLNAAPARPIDVAPDLLVVNSLEREVVGDSGRLVAVTLGADGAVLLEDGQEVARARPPEVEAVDGTAAGDAFTACLLVSLLEGRGAGGSASACMCCRCDRSLSAGRATLPANRCRGRRHTHVISVPILFDCDPGHDDAIALLLALASPEVEVLGVTTVAGNQTLDKTTANALRVLELVGHDGIPVAAGADGPLERELFTAQYVHGESGLDGPVLSTPRGHAVEQHAADFLAERIAPGVVLVATGPLTNVALLLDRGARPGRIVLMGGAIGEGNVTQAAEFNIWVDPEAAERVFTSGVDVTMVGLDVTHKPLMTPADAQALAATGRVGTFVAELHAFFHRFHEARYGWPGSPIHDAVAMAHVIDPTLIETKHCYVRIETEPEARRGRTVVDLEERLGLEPTAHVGIDIDADRFLALLFERLASLG